MASRNKDERAYVNALIKAIQKNSPGVYVHIDRDAGAARHTSSGWDFLLACHGLVVFAKQKSKRESCPIGRSLSARRSWPVKRRMS